MQLTVPDPTSSLERKIPASPPRFHGQPRAAQVFTDCMWNLQAHKVQVSSVTWPGSS